MKALWWWIDRWQGSSAYKALTLEEQGAYRNLLDECWLRDGALPADERVLARACGDPLSWDRLRYKVMAHFALDPLTGEWRNPTLDRVLRESKRKAANERRRRLRLAGRDIPPVPVVRGADGRFHRDTDATGHLATHLATVLAICPGETSKPGHAPVVSVSPAEEESDSEARRTAGGGKPPSAAQERRGREPHPRGACSDPLCCEQPATTRAAHA